MSSEKIHCLSDIHSCLCFPLAPLLLCRSIKRQFVRSMIVQKVHKIPLDLKEHVNCESMMAQLYSKDFSL